MQSFTKAGCYFEDMLSVKTSLYSSTHLYLVTYTGAPNTTPDDFEELHTPLRSMYRINDSDLVASALAYFTGA